MDSNSWFYSLSAIPQTLAAMIALTATFVVYKLSRIKDYISRHAEEVKIFLPHLVPEEKITDPGSIFEEKVAELLGRGLKKLDISKEDLGTTEFKHLKNAFDNILHLQHIHLESTKENLFDYLNHKNQIITTLINKKNLANRALKNSLFFTAMPIALSLVLLPLYGILAGRPLILTLMIAASCFSIAYTAYTVWQISNL